MIARRTLLGAGAAVLAAPALAQPRWPDRPIEIQVGFVAGGGTDLDARSYARALEKRIGGTVVVTNRPGAGGELALGAMNEGSGFRRCGAVAQAATLGLAHPLLRGGNIWQV